MMRRRPQIWNGILAVKSGSKVLVNGETAQVGTGSKLSGFPTNQMG